MTRLSDVKAKTGQGKKKQRAFNFGQQQVEAPVYEVLGVEEPVLERPVSRQEESEFSETLTALKLHKYTDKLREVGCSSLKQMSELGEMELEKMGIPLGHKLKLMKKIKQLKVKFSETTNQS